MLSASGVHRGRLKIEQQMLFFFPPKVHLFHAKTNDFCFDLDDLILDDFFLLKKDYLKYNSFYGIIRNH